MDSGRPLCVNSRRSTANVRTRAGANRGWGPIRCTWGNNKPDRTKTQQKISQVHGYKSRPISRNLAEISIAYVIGKREAPPSEAEVDLDSAHRRRGVVTPEVKSGLESVHVDDRRDVAGLERLPDRAVHQRVCALDVAEMP